jgi:hypothetical protein
MKPCVNFWHKNIFGKLAYFYLKNYSLVFVKGLVFGSLGIQFFIEISTMAWQSQIFDKQLGSIVISTTSSVCDKNPKIWTKPILTRTLSAKFTAPTDLPGIIANDWL